MNAPTLSTLSLVFDYVLRASLLGTAAIALVLLIRSTLGHRLAPGVRSWLWLPVAVLCLSPQLPGLVEWRVSAETLPQPVKEEEVIPVEEGPVVVRGEPRPLLGVSEPRPTALVIRLTLKEKMALGWAAGSSALLLFWLAAYAGLWRRIRRLQVPVSESLAGEYQVCVRLAGFQRAPRLMVSAAVESPAVAGLWRPVVLMPPHLPSSLEAEALRHILLHELTHLRRKDLWLHWTSALVAAVHWFNPFVWLAARKFRGDRESACDATVIRLGEIRAHAYGQTLLVLESRVTQPVALRLMAGILGGADLVRQRIVDIAHLGKTSRRAGWLAFLMVLGGAAVIALAAAEPPVPKVTISPSSQGEAKVPSSSGLYTRTFKVGADFLAWSQIAEDGKSQPVGTEHAGNKTAIEVLKALGVSFPEGASAAFIPTTSQLIIRNTLGNLELIEAIVAARNSHPGHQIHVTSHLVVFKEGSMTSLFGAVPIQTWPAVKDPPKERSRPLIVQHRAMPTDMSLSVAGVFTDTQFNALLQSLMGKPLPASKSAEVPNVLSFSLQELSSKVEAVIGFPSVVTRSGDKATLEVLREFIYPVAYDKEEAKQGEGSRYTAKEFGTRHVGFRLEIDPVIGPDGHTLDLNLTPQLPALTGWMDTPLQDGGKLKTPTFHVNNVTTAITIWDGQTVAFGGEANVSPFLMDPSLMGEQSVMAKKYPVMIFVTAKLIDASGNPVKEKVPKAEKTESRDPVLAPSDSSPKKADTSNRKGTSRARIDVGSNFRPPNPNQPDEKFTADFVGTNIELLQSSQLRKRAEERMRVINPDLEAVPVVLTAERVRDTTQVEIFASAGENTAYARLFLDCLLDEMAAFRQERIRESVFGTINHVLKEVLEKESEIKHLLEEQARATRENAPQQKLNKIKADLDRVRDNHRVWKEKLKQVETAMLPERRAAERAKHFQIIERPTPVEAEEK